MIPHLQKDFGMAEAFLFSPFLPLNTGNVVNAEPMAAEKLAWSGAGLTQSWAGGTKPGTFSWQGGFNNAGTETPRPRRALHTHRKSRRRNKQPIGKKKNTAGKGDKSSASHTQTTSPQIKPPLPRTKVPPTKAFESPVFIYGASRYL